MVFRMKMMNLMSGHSSSVMGWGFKSAYLFTAQLADGHLETFGDGGELKVCYAHYLVFDTGNFRLCHWSAQFGDATGEFFLAYRRGAAFPVMADVGTGNVSVFGSFHK